MSLISEQIIPINAIDDDIDECFWENHSSDYRNFINNYLNEEF